MSKTYMGSDWTLHRISVWTVQDLCSTAYRTLWTCRAYLSPCSNSQEGYTISFLLDTGSGGLTSSLPVVRVRRLHLLSHTLVSM